MRREHFVRTLVLIAAVPAICAPVVSAQTLQLTPSFDEPQRPAPAGQKPTEVGAQKAPVPAWVTAMKHSLVLLAIEHGTRLALDSKTRNELSGPFFRDYIDSVHIPRDWDDGDSVAVNYVGHPIHGAAAGYLYRDAAGVRGSSRFGLSPSYWATMGKSTAFIGVYSLQFEFGPLSEASIGNVGRHPATRGWVDHVVTPVMGFALMAAEDALDRYFVLWFEDHVDNRAARATIRLLFNPARLMANLAQGRSPWYRPDRPLGR
jgi:hypothetical protein